MYYFIGIKGSGMASLACILHDLGYEVFGSDLDKHFFTEEELKKRNIRILPFSQDNIKDGMNVIIGNAFKDDFCEVATLSKFRNIKRWHYHEFLGEFIKNYRSFAVSGSHGKTTTTGMLAAMLNYQQPTGYLIGDGSGHVTSDSINMVIEADEYRRHFLAYQPDYAIVTNVDLDHVDYFKDDDDYALAYEEFAKKVVKTSVLFGDDLKIRKLDIKNDHLYYGENDDNDVQAINIIESSIDMSFDVIYKKRKFGHFRLPFVGRHLLWNSLGVISIGILLGLNAEAINEGLRSFKGVKRRFVVEKVKNSTFIDDYAHHPTEVDVTIKAAKTRFPNQKIIAIFKPHRVSRVFRFKDAFVKALSQADVVCLCPFTSIDDKEEGIDIDITYLQKAIPNSIIVDENDNDAKTLADMGPAVYLFMSSKDIYGLSDLVKSYQKD
ncbi:MAG: UDP-N-acetylmuramate--L-alanine ligase [Erysipelotrichaceae bacterium]|nr:UDP-N-acetylmuramate--L-alanine ligase [Erysipelotrichaceae bacterium]